MPGGNQSFGTGASVGVTVEDSIAIDVANGNLKLVNDSAAPGNSKYYGTNAVGVLGYNALPVVPFTSVLKYGADPTGVSDSTTAINNAIAAMPSAGGTLYFPAGTYKVSSTITISKPGTYLGDGPTSVTIVTSSATADVFLFNTSGIVFKGMQIQASVTRTAGYYINMGAGIANIYISEFFLTQFFWGIHMNAVASVIRDGFFINGVAGTGVGIVVDGSGSSIFHGLVMSNGSQIAAGIQFNVGGCFMSDCDISFCGNALNLSPGTGQVVADLTVVHCDFDHSVNGAVFNANPGSIVRCKFTGCWFSSHTVRGVLMQTGGAGGIDGVTFVNCEMHQNGSDGVTIATTAISNVRIFDSALCGNTNHGINLANGLVQFAISGNRIGNGFSFVGNGGWGIVFGGANNDCVVTGNDLRGNTAGEMTGTPAVSATVVIANNI